MEVWNRNRAFVCLYRVLVKAEEIDLSASCNFVSFLFSIIYIPIPNVHLSLHIKRA